MFMLKKGRKKGVTLIELMVALSLFILLAIPITHAIIQNIKSNNSAQIEKEKVMAINYGYENLKMLVDTVSLKVSNDLQELKSEQGNNLEYVGRMKTYTYKYNSYVKENESYFTKKGTTLPIDNKESEEGSLEYEFESEIITVSLNVYEKESNKLIKTENYIFRSKAISE